MAGLATAIALFAAAHPARGEAPKRVVSMNLCTDQLAMLMASDGQLYSVSHLAKDPAASVLAEEAAPFVTNHGLAEEIFLMKPDLILSGTYTTRATVDILKRLGFRVEEFQPESSFDDIRANVRRMGTLLGRDARAEELLQAMDAALASVPSRSAKTPTIALYYANQFTSGRDTLAGEVVNRAGLNNLGEKLGLQGTQKLSLEQLVMAKPDLIAAHDAYPAPALAYEAQVHPAFRAALQGKDLIDVPDKYWICGAPFTAQAVKLLSDAAQRESHK
ncbi:ABC transporter substrate-binding protein [Phyllobacterium myrsinacearum]|uniref:Iron complex transport system substrate-binding protein n=1 Tax=Phyllobacterium myrsinacearum TaxID=28101 RepID=A0A839EQQ9_9HYPH|nr:ABC transporter substrate-binding protein [Phyllobacterium myrsinacearum]MBA8879844.1 iron complex transport system substrate-binding protein [Phyllobacterium myrsinacearum]